MLFTVDIGNTHIVVGLLDGSSKVRSSGGLQDRRRRQKMNTDFCSN